MQPLVGAFHCGRLEYELNVLGVEIICSKEFF
jgi:hypothetical protein